MKGELAAAAEYDAAVAAYGAVAPADDGGDEVVLRPLLDGRVAEIRWRRGDDVGAVARDFVAAAGLASGGGCDDAACVAALLADAMAAAAAEPGAAAAVGGGRPRALAPYAGHVDAALDVSGMLDVGAVAVRTDVARRVGFGWRHHAADFAYVGAVRSALAAAGLAAHKVAQTLYVHN